MQGDYVSLWVYSRGEAARDLPYLLWKMIEDAGDWDKIMWSHNCVEDKRVSIHGDLIDWMTMLLHEEKVWILISDNVTGDICGMGWFANLQEYSATTHIWMIPAYRGKPHVREAIKLGLAFGHAVLHKPVLQSFTPWPLARNAARKAGFNDVCFIPTLFGKDVWLLEHKEEVQNGS